MSNNNMVRFRWCGMAFYQIELPDGTTIITDPCQYGLDDWWTAEEDYRIYRNRTAADMLERCDYIILTHIHIDHIMDLSYVTRKFPDARIIVPEGEMLPLLLKNNYSTLLRNISMVGDRDRLCFPEFTLDCYRGKHTLFASTDPFVAKAGIKEEVYKDVCRDEDGSVDYIETLYQAGGGMDLHNYVITLPNGMSLFIWSGQILEDFRRWRYRGLKPDLMFVQIANKNIGGDRSNPSGETIGNFTADVEPRMVFPIHHEKFTKKCIEAIRQQCLRYYQEKELSIQYENPEIYQWNTATKSEGGEVRLIRQKQ